VFAKPSLPSVFCRALGKYFAECPTLGKVWNEKNPKKIAKNIFFTRGGLHRPALARQRYFSHATRLMGFEPVTSPSRITPLPLHHTVTYV
jgi:hypothetical protein